MKFLISGASSSLSKAIARELIDRGNELTLVGRSSQPAFDFLNLYQHYLKTTMFFASCAFI